MSRIALRRDEKAGMDFVVSAFLRNLTPFSFPFFDLPVFRTAHTTGEERACEWSVFGGAELTSGAKNCKFLTGLVLSLVTHPAHRATRACGAQGRTVKDRAVPA